MCNVFKTRAVLVLRWVECAPFAGCGRPEHSKHYFNNACMHARWRACKSEPFTSRLTHLQVVKLAGLETYLAKAEKPLPGAPAVVLIHDIFGWEAKNVRLYADKMAQQGALWPSGAAHRETGRVACHSRRPACARRRSARKLGHACRRSGSNPHNYIGKALTACRRAARLPGGGAGLLRQPDDEAGGVQQATRIPGQVSCGQGMHCFHTLFHQRFCEVILLSRVGPVLACGRTCYIMLMLCMAGPAVSCATNLVQGSEGNLAQGFQGIEAGCARSACRRRRRW